MDIRRGKVLELDSKAGDLVDITVNGKVLARGDLNIFDDGSVGVTFVEIL
jgi:flagellar motor switch/type III secretory pathway protein FliN